MQPMKLYKYKSLDETSAIFTKSILTDNEVFFPKFSDLNDPFEGHFKMVLPETPQGREMAANGLRVITEGILSINPAVLSLSQVKNNLLMWAHYSDNHTGICIEFDSTIPGSIFHEAKPVAYVHKFESHTLGNPFEKEMVTNLAAFVKSKHWRYEKEWRIIRQDKGCQPFSPKSITGVILGCKISDENKAWVVEWANKRKEPVQIYEAKKQFDRFGLDIEKLRIK